MEDLSLHILDIAENAVRAEAKKIGIIIKEDEKKNSYQFVLRMMAKE